MSAFELLQGDCLQQLATLPAASVQCCVTSPPYWGLRDYGTAKWEGGDETCDHKMPIGQRQDVGRVAVDGFNGPVSTHLGERNYRDICGKCGARRIDAQLGLEATPDEYVANMVTVFRAVRRVLRDDGTLWLNLGDSYAAGGTGGASDKSRLNGGRGVGPNEKIKQGVAIQRAAPPGLKPKDLVGIPWRVAFALQADGWYLRQDIIWHKPNPMPESVTDRCTKSHEYIFLLTKSARYYYDANAIAEPVLESSTKRAAAGFVTSPRDDAVAGVSIGANERTRFGLREKFAMPSTRNKRSVWTVTTKPFKGAHFATFPPDLIEPCVLASTSHFGACAECKTPYQRLVEKGDVPKRKTRDNLLGVYPGRKTTTRLNTVDMAVIPTTTTGWGKMCNCTTDAVEPCVILDPFSGAGTTGVVAIKHSRCYIGTELNPDYLEISRKRIQAEWDGITLPMF